MVRYGELFGSSRGQVYKALDRLEREGLIEALEPPPGARSHEHYGMTAKGADALSEWLATPLSDEETAPTQRILARMRSTDEVEHLTRLLDIYEAIVTEELEADLPIPRERAARWLQRLTRERWAAELNWIFWVRGQLRTMMAGAAGGQLRSVDGAAVQTGP